MPTKLFPEYAEAKYCYIAIIVIFMEACMGGTHRKSQVIEIKSVIDCLMHILKEKQTTRLTTAINIVL